MLSSSILGRQVKSSFCLHLFAQSQRSQRALRSAVSSSTPQALRPAAPMGSLGWAQCYWCWRWEYNMHIPDFVFDSLSDEPFDHGGALCYKCECRLFSGQRPPWQPDAIGRAARTLAAVGWTSSHGQRFPDSALTIVALFLEPSDKP